MPRSVACRIALLSLLALLSSAARADLHCENALERFSTTTSAEGERVLTWENLATNSIYGLARQLVQVTLSDPLRGRLTVIAGEGSGCRAGSSSHGLELLECQVPGTAGAFHDVDGQAHAWQGPVLWFETRQILEEAPSGPRASVQLSIKFHKDARAETRIDLADCRSSER
jgi:hypothetical protein